jgi:quercetin dioxygenase-like cupin family protein
MSGTEAPELTIIQPGQGKEAFLGTIGVVFKLFGEQTNGLVSIVEHPFPVGACVPPHLHTKEDEYSIVTEGEIGFRSGDREVVLGPGGYITKPRGEVHTMWNAGRVPARMIEVISPAGFEHFSGEWARLRRTALPTLRSSRPSRENTGSRWRTRLGWTTSSPATTSRRRPASGEARARAPTRRR